MSSLRRDFLKELLAVGTLPGFMASPGAGRAIGALLDQDSAQSINPDLDLNEYRFWSDFLSSDAKPIVGAYARARGAGPRPDDAQPVFLHYGPEGFRNAAELDPGKLVSSGDVMVSVNTSTVKIAEADLKTFQRLQNAQIRVDVAQKTGIVPILEAMAYTVVGVMRSIQAQTARPSDLQVHDGEKGSANRTKYQRQLRRSVAEDAEYSPPHRRGQMGIESRSAKKGIPVLQGAPANRQGVGAVCADAWLSGNRGLRAELVQ